MILRVGSLLLLSGLLFGCAGLNQFPESSTDYTADLKSLDPEYDTVLQEIKDSGSDAAKQKSIRNHMIETRMAVIDRHFKDYVAALAKENSSVDLGVALVGVGVGGAGSLVSETASQILSAVSGGLAGGKAAYDKAVLYDQALSALIAQMQASRKVIAAEIFENWTNSTEEYPLWLARRHLEAYEFAGSIPGAIMATAADAKVKEGQADKKISLTTKVTKAGVTPEAFQKRADLRSTIEGLSGANAILLLARIQTAFPDTKATVDTFYPPNVRAQDADGALAKQLLAQLVVDTALTDEAFKKWNDELSKL
jgi:hypothetical protein